MNNIQKVDMMITNMKELHNEALRSSKDTLVQEYAGAIEVMERLLDREIESAAIADDGWSAAEMRSMAGEQL